MGLQVSVRQKPFEAGELSRVILGLKALLAQEDAVETIIFDEVDSGIGGATAQTVGQKMADLSKTRQVLCITHLAQIARFGDHHYQIVKKVADNRTMTTITELSKEDRIREMARMIGGEPITQASLEHAKEMLNQR